MKKLFFILSFCFIALLSSYASILFDSNLTESNSTNNYPIVSGWCETNISSYNFSGTLINISPEATTANILLDSPKFSSWEVSTIPERNLISAVNNYIQVSALERSLIGTSICITGVLEDTGETISITLIFRSN
ncbi:MAG: hypothetical protein PUK02_05835 [Parabacteroides sp.]|uniref:Uncharacterized protein n=1 Tax=Parabacteroides faecalis TaxID=2924040 RepID=A0ABT0C3X0_9BACT|nr:hypothetical protein [Parabacteroides faecalis]MCI7286336.1 hypothetical protein [Parabacteroides sp.]MDY5623337.1 hypothetical protein [Bacteroidales bacterium]MCI7357192.1 hypothetical protein [Parabacteroides sp.]MCI7707669.1 hypothetical protein [Parabacteroides sp.]MCJ2381573.1 hypothetical protein [Parabacteroides faecalis]